MGFLSRIFGGSKSTPTQPSANVQPIEYKGHQIYPGSLAEGGQFRIAGRICKTIDGEPHEHTFIRSDLLLSQGDADELMVKKAKIFIDQMGDNIYS